MSRLHDKIIHEAALIAPMCDGRFRHISFLVHRNNIISIGINKHKTHPLAAKFGHRHNNIHSELDCLINYRGSIALRYCDLYNIRIRPRGELGISKPCSHCQILIASYDLRHVFYTTDYGLFEQFQ